MARPNLDIVIDCHELETLLEWSSACLASASESYVTRAGWRPGTGSRTPAVTQEPKSAGQP
jgi:hypothetical protein